jgi:hypothetical protein
MEESIPYGCNSTFLRFMVGAVGVGGRYVVGSLGGCTFLYMAQEFTTEAFE